MQRWRVRLQLMAVKPEERWLPYPNDPRFTVSDLGRVRGVRGHLRSLAPMPNGRVMVSVTRIPKAVSYSVSRMVLETFVGPQPVGCTCSHINGSPADNRLINLVWESHSANCLRKRVHGTSLDGEKNPMSKLTASDIRAIRSSLLSSTKAAVQFGVSATHIKRIRRKEAWSGVET